MVTKHLNVMKKPISIFSKQPVTGFYRDGFCNVGPEDTGNHSVAAILTESFLDFSASRGSNLRSIGLTAGCKRCLCAGRWQEALLYAKSQNKKVEGLVPKVNLAATHEKALDKVNLEDLRSYAEPESTI